MKKLRLFFIVWACMVGFSYAQTISVTNPHAGTSLFLGRSCTVTWTSTGSMNSRVKLLLFSGNMLKATISESTNNSGSFIWTVPGTLKTGTYIIRVQTIENQVFGDSAPFSITFGTQGTGQTYASTISSKPATQQPQPLIPIKKPPITALNPEMPAIDLVCQIRNFVQSMHSASFEIWIMNNGTQQNLSQVLFDFRFIKKPDNLFLFQDGGGFSNVAASTWYSAQYRLGWDYYTTDANHGRFNIILNGKTVIFGNRLYYVAGQEHTVLIEVIADPKNQLPMESKYRRDGRAELTIELYHYK